MKITRQEYNDLIARNPRLKPSDETRSPAPSTTNAKPVKRRALVSASQRSNKSGTRYQIVFEIFAVRPNDWDNPRIKNLQDMLVHAGILHDDSWDVLRGCIDPQKVSKEEEEKTVITITKI